MSTITCKFLLYVSNLSHASGSVPQSNLQIAKPSARSPNRRLCVIPKGSHGPRLANHSVRAGILKRPLARDQFFRRRGFWLTLRINFDFGRRYCARLRFINWPYIRERFAAWLSDGYRLAGGSPVPVAGEVIVIEAATPTSLTYRIANKRQSREVQDLYCIEDVLAAGRMALHRARQAAAECLHREFQRAAARRVAQRDPVYLARPRS